MVKIKYSKKLEDTTKGMYPTDHTQHQTHAPTTHRTYHTQETKVMRVRGGVSVPGWEGKRARVEPVVGCCWRRGFLCSRMRQVLCLSFLHNWRIHSTVCVGRMCILSTLSLSTHAPGCTPHTQATKRHHVVCVVWTCKKSYKNCLNVLFVLLLLSPSKHFFSSPTLPSPPPFLPPFSPAPSLPRSHSLSAPSPHSPAPSPPPPSLPPSPFLILHHT